MKKLLSIIILITLLVASQSFAFSNLWEFYGGNLPSIQERAGIFSGISSETYRGTFEQNIKLLNYLENYFNPEDENLIVGGDTQLFLGGSTYTLSGSGITSSASSISLTSLTLPQNSYPIQDSDLSNTFYITLEPGNTSRQEFVSCTTVGTNTGGAVTLSGCTRGLSPISPYTASTTLRFSHSGGTKVIFSNPPQLYDQAAFKGNDESITGIWSYLYSNPPRYSATPTLTGNDLYFASVKYVDDLANQGAATSTETNGGISELATEIEVASSTATTANKPLVIQAQNATSTPTYSCDTTGTTGALCIPVAENDGKLNQNWLDLTDGYAFSGTNTHSGRETFNTATTTLNATTSIAASANTAPLYLNGLTYNMPSTRAASSTILMEDGSGNLTFQKSPYSILYSSSAQFTTGTTTVTIPAGLLLGINKLRIDFDCTVSSPNYSYVRIGNGSATTTMAVNSNSQGGGMFYVVPQSATSQIYYGYYRNDSNAITAKAGTALSLTAANKIYITFELTSGNFYNAMVTLITQ